MGTADFMAFEVEDCIKIALALVAGVLLGFERELKDKAAGLKTITLITLGSTVFTLLSYKIGAGPSEDAARIASYVVSGIGFLGAGVIFKTNYSVSGLTTAATIWAAAAVGMSIGFGQYTIAALLLLGAGMILIIGTPVSMWLFKPKTLRSGFIEFKMEELPNRMGIIQEIRGITLHVEEKMLEVDHERGRLYLDITMYKKDTDRLEDYLIQHPQISGFQL